MSLDEGAGKQQIWLSSGLAAVGMTSNEQRVPFVVWQKFSENETGRMAAILLATNAWS